MTIKPKCAHDIMLYPFFALSKKPDFETFQWSGSSKMIIVRPSFFGRATVFDKDILLYFYGRMARSIDEGEQLERTFRCKASDILNFCQWGNGGKDYARLWCALGRLSGTRIETNIQVDELLITEEFAIFESWSTFSSPGKKRIKYIEVTLSDWFFQQGVKTKRLLTYSEHYFRIKSPTLRRLYEILRKYAGNTDMYPTRIAKIFHSVGSNGTKSDFVKTIKRESKPVRDGHYEGKIGEYKFFYSARSSLMSARIIRK